ncbi:Clp protease N-terminal domain-containing protein [Arthrobacter sp. ISL-30]|uniref:Clp protease N-terminal domain-containing protein n=1 Tax=Arthrobacter sp. ISL-30 TaxID=2819109 RepID=UPI0035B25178
MRSVHPCRTHLGRLGQHPVAGTKRLIPVHAGRGTDRSRDTAIRPAVSTPAALASPSPAVPALLDLRRRSEHTQHRQNSTAWIAMYSPVVPGRDLQISAEHFLLALARQDEGVTANVLSTHSKTALREVIVGAIIDNRPSLEPMGFTAD